MNPHELAEKRVELSALYSRDSELLSEILALRPGIWMELRKDVKSDKAADRAYEASELGIQEMRLRNRMKASEKEMSAIRTMLEVLSGEAKNQW